jgi:hypothetical protein
MLSFGVPTVVWIVTVYIPYTPDTTHEVLQQDIVPAAYAFGWGGTVAYCETALFFFCLLYTDPFIYFLLQGVGLSAQIAKNFSNRSVQGLSYLSFSLGFLSCILFSFVSLHVLFRERCVLTGGLLRQSILLKSLNHPYLVSNLPFLVGAIAQGALYLTVKMLSSPAPRDSMLTYLLFSQMFFQVILYRSLDHIRSRSFRLNSTPSTASRALGPFGPLRRYSGLSKTNSEERGDNTYTRRSSTRRDESLQGRVSTCGIGGPLRQQPQQPGSPSPDTSPLFWRRRTRIGSSRQSSTERRRPLLPPSPPHRPTFHLSLPSPLPSPSSMMSTPLVSARLPLPPVSPILLDSPTKDQGGEDPSGNRLDLTYPPWWSPSGGRPLSPPPLSPTSSSPQPQPPPPAPSSIGGVSRDRAVALTPLRKLPVFSYEIRVLPQLYDSVEDDDPGNTEDGEDDDDDDSASSSSTRSSLDSFHSLGGSRADDDV